MRRVFPGPKTSPMGRDRGAASRRRRRCSGTAAPSSRASSSSLVWALSSFCVLVLAVMDRAVDEDRDVHSAGVVGEVRAHVVAVDHLLGFVGQPVTVGSSSSVEELLFEAVARCWPASSYWSSACCSLAG